MVFLTLFSSAAGEVIRAGGHAKLDRLTLLEMVRASPDLLIEYEELLRLLIILETGTIGPFGI